MKTTAHEFFWMFIGLIAVGCMFLIDDVWRIATGTVVGAPFAVAIVCFFYAGALMFFIRQDVKALPPTTTSRTS